jgi:DNA repair protein RadD
LAAYEAANASPGLGAGAQKVTSLGKQLDPDATPNIAESQPIALRDYQLDGVARIHATFASGSRRVLFQLPTGGGKTRVFSFIVAGAVKRGRRVLILAHRVEIIEQFEAAVALTGVAYGLIAPRHRETNDLVQIASVTSSAQPKRLECWRDKFDFIVIDECHHAVAGSWARVLASQPRAAILGVTATPERLDGRGLGEIFDELVIGPTTAQLIADTWLSPFTVFEPTAAPDMSAAKIRGGDFAVEDLREAMDGVVIGAAVSEYQRLCPGISAVAFCVDIEHSKAVAQRFNEAGVRAQHIDGEMPSAERRAMIAALGSGALQVLTNCGLISEGVDVPAIVAAILLRPTASLPLFLQQVGRTLRPSKGKTRALILDFSGNVARHGLPDEPREWTLDSKPQRQRAKAYGLQLRKCRACNALTRPSAHECGNCGADLRTPRERREIEMALRLAQQREDEDLVRSLMYRDRLAWAGSDERRLRLVERTCGYKSGWTRHRLRELAEQQRGGSRQWLRSKTKRGRTSISRSTATCSGQMHGSRFRRPPAPSTSSLDHAIEDRTTAI